jgi:hypothetical protein
MELFAYGNPTECSALLLQTGDYFARQDANVGTLVYRVAATPRKNGACWEVPTDCGMVRTRDTETIHGWFADD